MKMVVKIGSSVDSWLACLVCWCSLLMVIDDFVVFSMLMIFVGVDFFSCLLLLSIYLCYPVLLTSSCFVVNIVSAWFFSFFFRFCLLCLLFLLFDVSLVTCLCWCCISQKGLGGVRS